MKRLLPSNEELIGIRDMVSVKDLEKMLLISIRQLMYYLPITTTLNI
jgi:hypothetical protein